MLFGLVGIPLFRPSHSFSWLSGAWRSKMGACLRQRRREAPLTAIRRQATLQRPRANAYTSAPSPFLLQRYGGQPQSLLLLFFRREGLSCPACFQDMHKDIFVTPGMILLQP
jgi:hypothetical protein